MRRASLALAALATALVAGCGGGADESAPVSVATVESTGEGSLPAWVAERLAAPAPDAALVFGTSDYGPGTNRISFLLVRDDGSTVDADEALVWVGREGDEPRRTVARAERLAPAAGTAHTGHDDGEVREILVAHVETPESGRWWVVVEPPGGELQGIGTMEVAPERAAPAVGERAIASDTPTLADAPAEELSTARPPDTELLRTSVADALAAGHPFVVVFATPEYCTSRMCGPTVEVVGRAARAFRGAGIRFIHVEIYEGNDPENGVNEWVAEWRLPSEPWTFVVDAGGTIRAAFEGAVSDRELAAAVERELGASALHDDEAVG